MDYKKFYSEHAHTIFKSMDGQKFRSGQFVSFSKTIIQNEDKFIKIFLGARIIDPGNLGHYKKNYSSVDDGIQDAIKLINSIDNTITDYEYKSNYYLYLEQHKVDTHYRLHSKELISQFDDIEQYIVYVRDNILRRYEALKPLIFNDYHAGNIMIDKDLNWTNIDQDGAIRYGLGMSREAEINLVKRRLPAQGKLIKYDADYIVDIWDNK